MLSLSGGEGAFTLTIPPESVTKDRWGRFAFNGEIEDEGTGETALLPFGDRVFLFTLTARRIDLSDLDNPLTLDPVSWRGLRHRHRDGPHAGARARDRAGASDEHGREP